MLKGNEMRIIARGTLRRFVESRAGHKDQPTLKAALNAWFADVRKADWRSSADVKRLCLGRHRECRPNCVQHQGKQLSTGRVGGLREGIVWIKWVGTHRNYDRPSYDRIDVRRVEHAGR
jgi:mRNA interferase HigB